MSIVVVCPNGHSLRVKDGCAGKTGLCPVCRARILVPQPEDDGLSEEDIMGILGQHDPSRVRPSVASGMATAGHVMSAKMDPQVSSPPKKSCQKCNAQIPAGTHICPQCHTYLTDLGRL